MCFSRKTMQRCRGFSLSLSASGSDIHWCGCKRSRQGWPGSACKCPWCSEERSEKRRYHNQWRSEQEHKALIFCCILYILGISFIQFDNVYKVEEGSILGLLRRNTRLHALRLSVYYYCAFLGK